MTLLAAPEQAPAVLEARGLTKHFAVHGTAAAGRRLLRRGRGLPAGPAPVVHAVDDVSLQLTPAHVTAVVGESGSGKSTLARLLARLVMPTSGELLLGGKPAPAGQRRRIDYAKTVQMVLQDPFASLNPVHDVYYHLSRPFRVHGLAKPGADLDEKIAAVLERVSLTPADAFWHKYPHELDRRHVRRAGGRVGTGRPGHRLPRPPIYPAAAQRGPGPGADHAGHAARPRRPAERRSAAIRLPVPYPVPARDGNLRRAGAAGLPGRPRARQLLLAARHRRPAPAVRRVHRAGRRRERPRRRRGPD